MPRTARLIAVGHPHHVTHRGLERQRVFFDEADYRSYLRILQQETQRSGTAIWAYCLMPNHVHLILTPSRPDSLGRCMGETSRSFANLVNRRRERAGALWQSRFYSAALDEQHLLEAIRYILLNPVRANLCGHVALWPWSSYRAHLSQCSGIIEPAALAGRVYAWEAFLEKGTTCDAANRIRTAVGTGRPMGNRDFAEDIARAYGVKLPDRGPGRPSKTAKILEA
ncbi:transposase [Bradyrhizobium sp. BRP19]|uniref:REP-associated tyrosine transposase n=1 Tax=Bradyrhizobium sp. BRP19 TaxID=2793823 RepID=UPI001CD3FDC0|nr:transposase [Bradyrhizobium sp. BRP19]MCA1549930.1 transposase [Bradyrhizobium sp. BRP19]